MAEKSENSTEKSKSGVGKFFLGAALGAIAGAIAGKFISTSIKDDEDEDEDDSNEEEHVCGCDETCNCSKKSKKQDKVEE